MPFFVPGNLVPFAQTIRCGLASIGDGLIMLAAFWIARLIGGADWPYTLQQSAVSAFVAFGIVVAVLVEMIATSLPPDSLLAWRYSDLMPIIPTIDLAVIPMVMWLVVPLSTLMLFRYATRADIP